MKNNLQNTDVYTLIMAGGVGSRFWPKSRNEKPKQFIDMMGVGASLLQATYDRARLLSPNSNILISTNEQYVTLINEQIPLEAGNILIEPARRNTAPCIAYAAFKLYMKDPNAIMLVVPSDHVIEDTAMYRQKVNEAIEFVRTNDALLTLGIPPTRPDTGYGYIHIDNTNGNGVSKVNSFKEKPSATVAEAYVSSGEYLWNAGIFIWKASTVLEALRNYTPDVYELFLDGTEYYNTSKEEAFIASKYPQATSISIDFAIMEKATNVYSIPANIGWSDLGTWNAQHSISQKDIDNNVLVGGDSNLFDTKGCMISTSKDKLVVIDGLEDYIIADDNNVLLIYPKRKEQEIKKITEDLKTKGLSHYL